SNRLRPSAARWRAKAAPMPAEAPVIRAVRFWLVMVSSRVEQRGNLALADKKIVPGAANVAAVRCLWTFEQKRVGDMPLCAGETPGADAEIKTRRHATHFVDHIDAAAQ